MSTTVEAFNDMMKQFIDELVLTFPSVKTFKKYQSSFVLIHKTKSRQALKEFYSSVQPFGDKIMAKDETFFTVDSATIDFVNDLNIQSIWNDTMSDSTKDAIWQYMQTLFIIATTISALPQETLSAIEDIAKNFDPSNLSSLMNMLGKNPPKI
jgi:hypothetical protein